MKFSLWKNKLSLSAVLIVASTSMAWAQTYQVTIKNLTQNQKLIGIHTSFHKEPHLIFQTGALLPELSTQFFYPSLLFAQGSQGESIETANVPIAPGKMITFEFKAKKRQKFFSFFSPLHATDDGFVGIDSILLPKRRNKVVTVQANAYDAGLFENTEICESDTVLTLLSPPEECAPHEVDEIRAFTITPENPVTTHSGIHGIGDLDAAKYDWKNPVAEISIRKVSKK